jgi:predicted GNAT family acetyltransferase
MHWRPATAQDVPELARLNQELIRDEGHDNPMDLPQLQRRMAGGLARGYRATLFSQDGRTLAYALYRDDERGGHQVRQFFVVRDARRAGNGRRAMQLLLAEVLRSGARVSLDVLTANAAAHAFYRVLGFTPYALTLEKSTPEARVSAFNYLQASEAVATSGVVPAASFGRIAAAGYATVVNLLPGVILG